MGMFVPPRYVCLRRLFALALLAQLIFGTFSGVSSQLCDGFSEIRLFSGRTAPEPVLFSWRMELNATVSIVRPNGAIEQLHPDEMYLYSYSFPVGNSSVVRSGGGGNCSFSVVNQRPCSYDPCGSNVQCFETDESYGCSNTTNTFCRYSLCEGARDMVYVAENNFQHTATWFYNECIASVYVKTEIDPFVEVDDMPVAGYFQHTFEVGTARVYVFGSGDIYLCSFDVRILPNPCSNDPCDENFRCILNSGGPPFFTCECRADLSFNDCTTTDLSGCASCNFDSQVCVNSSNDGFLCLCKDGLQMQQPCTPAFVSFTVDFVTVFEGGSTGTIGVFLSDTVNVNTSMDFKATDITATRGVDYNIPDDILIPRGHRSGFAAITIFQDDVSEDTEIFQVELVNVSSPVIVGAGTVVVEIVDEDSGIVCLATDQLFVREDAGEVAIPIQVMSHLPENDIVVGLQVAGLTAIHGQDFGGEEEIFVTIRAMESQGEARIPIIDDLIVEQTEIFAVYISFIDQPFRASEICDLTVGVFIEDNDRNECGLMIHDCDNISQVCVDTPEAFNCVCKAGFNGSVNGSCFDVESPTIIECTDDISIDVPVDTPGQVVNFTEPLAIDNSGEVNLASRSHFPGQFFTAGLTVVTYTFTDPALNSANCTFVINIRNTIQPVVSLSVSPLSLTEDEVATVSIEVSFPMSVDDITVFLDYEDVTATANVDYLITTTELSINAGELTSTSSVVLNDDELIEIREHFIVSIASVVGNVLIDPELRTMTITIEDNDSGTANIQIAPESVQEESQGGGFNVSVVINKAVQRGYGDIQFDIYTEFCQISPLEDIAMDSLNSQVTIPSGALISDIIMFAVIDDSIVDTELCIFNLEIGAIADDISSSVLALQAPTGVIIHDADTATVTFTPDRNILDEGEDIVYSIELSSEIEHYELDIDFQQVFNDQIESRFVTIPAGGRSASVRIVTEDDDIRQMMRTAEITAIRFNLFCVITESEGYCLNDLRPESRITIADDERSVTVLDNDKLQVGFSVLEFYVHEGNGSAFIPLTLLGASMLQDFPFVVEFTVILMSAGIRDFGPVPTGVTFLDSDDRVLQIPILQDEDEEADESFVISLSVSQSPSVELNDNFSEVTVTIIDDDGSRVFLSALSNSLSVREDEEIARVTFVLSEAAPNNATFVIGFLNGDAVIDRDFRVDTTSFTISANQLSSTVDVAIIDDLAVETNEYFVIFVDSVSDGIAIDRSLSTATITIVDDDSLDDIIVSPLSSTMTVKEGDDVIEVLFTLNGAVEEGRISLQYSAEDITATSSRDYQPLRENQILPAGSQTATMTVRITQDSIPEMVESFRVFISSTEPALTVTSATTTVIIDDDDEVCVRIQSTTANEEDGSVDVTVAVTQMLEADVVVDLQVTGQSATDEEDFVSDFSSVIIPTGEIFTTLTITILNDNVKEDNETFLVEITDVTFPGSLCDHTATAQVTILSNDQGPRIDFCPDDIEVAVSPLLTETYVRWDSARFSVNGNPVLPTVRPPRTEHLVTVGDAPILITYIAFDHEQGVSTCEFSVSAVVINDFRTYDVSMEVDAFRGFPEFNLLFEGVNEVFQRGSCWKDYAGMRIEEVVKSDSIDTNYVLHYSLLLIPISRCCVREMIDEANVYLSSIRNQLGPSVFARPSTHLPAFTETFQSRITLDTDTSVVDPNIFGDQTNQVAQNLRISLIEQISEGFAEEGDFISVCIPQPFQISSVIVAVNLETLKQQSTVDSFQTRLRDIIRNGLLLPDGLSPPEPSSVVVNDLCPDTLCSGHGVCIPDADLRKYEPRCKCNRGRLRADCSLHDPNFCPSGVMPIPQDTRATDDSIIIPDVGEIGDVLTKLNPDPCREFRGEDFLNYINITCERNTELPAMWNINLQCNATLEEYLEYLRTLQIASDNVEDVSLQLSNATNLFDNSGSMTSLMQTADLVNRIVNVNSTSQQVTGNVTVTISNVLTAEDGVLAESYVNGTTTMLIEAFERQLQQVETHPDGTYSQGSPNIIVMINEGNPAMLDGFGIATMTNGSDLPDDEEQSFGEFIVLNSTTENIQAMVNQSSNLLLYPDQISQSFFPEDSVRVANAVYRRPNIFSSRHYQEINNEFSKFERRVKQRLLPNTNVFSSTLYRNGKEILTWDRSVESGNENSTFRQWYRQLEDDDRNAMLETSLCSFWNFRADGGRGNWSTDGCRLVSVEEDGIINCECTHLTNFAVLMNVLENDSLTEVQLEILEAATIFGCGASILGLLLTALAFISDKNLRSKRPSQILLGLTFTMIAFYATFLCMVLLDSERKRAFLSDLSCSFMAGLMHFFLLSAVSWMIVEGVMMFYLFVRVMQGHIPAFFLKALIFTIGGPLLIVGITYGATTLAGGTYARRDVCFVSSPWPVLGGVAIPIFIALFFNITTYIRIVYNLSKSVPGRTFGNSAKRERRKRIQHAIAIFLLLGLTWVLGYLCWIPAGNVPSFIFQMCFVTINSGQGYLIFMLYCMRNPTFRKRWRKLIFFCPDQPLTRSLTSSGSSLQKSRRGDRRKFADKFRPSNVPFSSTESRRF